MWAYRLEGPLVFELHQIDEPPPPPDGFVTLRFRAGGICGSDIGRCLEVETRQRPGPFGHSLHEIVGDVVATRSDLPLGARVVGWVGGSLGLAELVVTEAEALATVEPWMSDIEAISLQPLACVLHAVERLPGRVGARVAIIGLGPIGLLFAHVLKDHGVASITGIDPVDRTAVADDYRIDHTVSAPAGTFASGENLDRFDLVVEAVGHQVGTLSDAIGLAAPGGTVLYFGNPCNRHYPVEMASMMDKGLTLVTGRTPQATRRQAMIRAQAYARTYPGMLDRYVTHVFSIDAAQSAYEVAARPGLGRLKVVLEATSTSPR